LIRNGVEAMATSPRKELEIRTAPGDAGFAVIHVSDTGTGIPRSLAAHVFDPFMTTKKSGMGVGLSICRTIVEAHGGKIWVETNEAGGATFTFSLPVPAQEPVHDH
jgi:two-component system, LuxR family, sensor kinase FixL